MTTDDAPLHALLDGVVRDAGLVLEDVTEVTPEVVERVLGDSGAQVGEHRPGGAPS